MSTFSAVLRDNGVSSFQQSFCRSFFALIYILLIFYWKKIDFSVNFKELRYYTLLGLIMGALGFFENTAVAVGTPVAVVVLLLYTQPIWTTIFGRVFLKERVNTLKKTAVVIAFFGIFLISKVWNVSSLNYLGVSLALICGILLSVEFIMIQELSIKPRYFLVSIFWFYLFRSGFTVIFGFLSRTITDNSIITSFTFSLPPKFWILILLFAFVPMFLGMILFYKSVKNVSIVSIGVIMLIEPISGVIYGYFLLGEYVDILTILGGALVLIASVLVIIRR
ncbi:MAG: DMT family transporter [Euryarchaeota archaeon]|nr:DMT family transporter [Euryarchaeota archaeon]